MGKINVQLLIAFRNDFLVEFCYADVVFLLALKSQYA